MSHTIEIFDMGHYNTLALHYIVVETAVKSCSLLANSCNNTPNCNDAILYQWWHCKQWTVNELLLIIPLDTGGITKCELHLLKVYTKFYCRKGNSYDVISN